MLTITPPLPPVALIAVPNSPGVETLLLVVTSTSPVIVVGERPPELNTLRIKPLSARIPTALEPSATIGPVAMEASAVTVPLWVVASGLPARATMPRPAPPWTDPQTYRSGHEFRW